MRRDKEAYPLAYALESARDDGAAQDDMSRLTCDAIDLIFDLAAHARAFDEPLPRGYIVSRVNSRPKRAAGGRIERFDLHHVARGWLSGGARVKVAERDLNGTRLRNGVTFRKHLHDGLIDEIGAYFVARRGKTERERDALSDSLRNVRHLRRVLLETDDV